MPPRDLTRIVPDPGVEEIGFARIQRRIHSDEGIPREVRQRLSDCQTHQVIAPVQLPVCVIQTVEATLRA